MEPDTLRPQLQALVASLGWANAVRFIQQYERGQGDYTHERDQILRGWDAQTLVEKFRELTHEWRAGSDAKMETLLSLEETARAL